MSFSKQETFLFFAQDAPGLCYWEDSNGNVQTSPIHAGLTQDLSIDVPDGWLQAELGFARNMTWMGMVRAFSIPQRFVKSAAYIIRYLMNTNAGQGIETPITITILKFNDLPGAGEPNYELYYKGRLDTPNLNDDVAEAVKCNMMEGGVMQTLKAMESVQFEIPCDGSIPENKKIYFDGMLYPDTAHYTFTPMSGVFPGICIAGCVLADEDGDNFGTQLGNPQYEQVVPNYYSTSANYLCSFELPTTVRLAGSITVRPFNSSNPEGFNLTLSTNQSTPDGSGGQTRTWSLVPANLTQDTMGHVYQVSQQTTYTFDLTIELGANENLFLNWFNQSSAHNIVIVAGAFDLSFNSMAPPTSVWAVSLYDAGKLLVQYMCELASQTFEPISFGFQSNLLQNNLGLMITSGDALRASGDPNYQKFYNAIQNNPNFPNINLVYSYGPVIKLTWRDYFEHCKVVFCAACGNIQLTGQNEVVFIEAMGDYVFNSSEGDIFDLGPVSKFSWSFNKDFYFNILEIGYPAQSYDQKSGKYETNTTFQWLLPFKSFTGKTLKLISPIRTDPYGMERLRSDIDATSTTRNDSDSSVFGVSTDLTKSAPDTLNASFISAVQNVSDGNNTNLLLQVNKNQQPLQFPTVQGGYFSQGTDPAIFVLNQSSLSGVSYPFFVYLQGTLIGNLANPLTGLPADSVTLNLYVNGVLINSWTFQSTAPLTNWSIGSLAVPYTFTRNWSYKDCVYMTMSTSVNGTANITAGTMYLNTGGAYFSASIIGIVTCNPGTPYKLIGYPAITAALDSHSIQVVSYGYQYLVFNTIVPNATASTLLQVSGFSNGGTSDSTSIDFFLNGVPVASETFPALGSIQPFQFTGSFTRDFQPGDILFVTASATNLSVWITQAYLTMSFINILAYKLYREKYDVLTGVPNLALDANGNPDSSLPGGPYNIVPYSPKRLMMTWFPYLKGVLYDQHGTVFFVNASKNQYQSTTLNGVTITENAPVDPSQMGLPMFIPRTLKTTMITPLTFSQVMTGTANAHIGWQYTGKNFYGFAMNLKQRPALYEAQEWEFLCSPITDLTQFVDLTDTGQNYLNMPSNSIFCSDLLGIQFVPEGVVLPAKYHTKSRNQFWFIEQVSNWINQNNFWEPWQNADVCPLQFITFGLTPVVVNVYMCNQTLVSSQNLTATPSNGVNSNYTLWQGILDLSTLAPGIYFLEIVAGAGGSTASLISEGLYVQADWPDTLLLEYTHSKNKEDMIFDTGFQGVMRTWGMYDNLFKQKYTGAFYKDQQQNITVLNSYRYEETKLWIGMWDGVPYWVQKKLAGILLLDGCMIEGEGFSISEGAEWEYDSVAGNPKMFPYINIRPTNNLSGVTSTITGLPDASMLITVDATVFGPNAYNESQGTEPDIISIITE
jgi:hypothetical protein